MKLSLVIGWMMALAACDRGGPPEALPAPPAAPPAVETTGAEGARESLYQVPLHLFDPNGPIGLDVDRGHPVLVGMFYAHCRSACPLLVSNIRTLEARLSEGERAGLRVLLVSFDGEHDTPDVLGTLTTTHRVDKARWRFAAAKAEDARTLAALLGIQYRAIDNGEFAHNSILTLLGPDGTILASTEALEPPGDDFVGRVRTALAPR